MSFTVKTSFLPYNFVYDLFWIVLGCGALNLLFHEVLEFDYIICSHEVDQISGSFIS